MRWKYSTNFIVSGQNGYVLLVDSRCEFTLRIDSVTQSHKGVYRCELDGESNDDTPKSAERTLSIARESGWLAGCLSVCPSVRLVERHSLFQSTPKNLCTYLHLLST